MTRTESAVAHSYYLPRQQFSRLVTAISAEGFRVIAPSVEGGAVEFTEVTDVDDYPRGVSSRLEAGQVHLQHSAGERLFDWVIAAQGLRPWLMPAREILWHARRGDEGRLVFEQHIEAPPTAIIGVRACDLAALKLNDAHYAAQRHADAAYVKRREALLLVAVNCAHSAATCFCAASGDGPEVREGYDLLLDELDKGYLLRAGESDIGQRILGKLALDEAAPGDEHAARQQTARAATEQSRALPGEQACRDLSHIPEHPHWAEIGQRCLGCGNCTLVCPTCFCSSNHSEPALDGAGSSEIRQWDSCFSPGHSSIAGLQVRDEISQRYRQWLTHKLSGWFDQYGRSGCVGCGRCIAWCPVAIDITQEARNLAGEIAHAG